MEEYLIKKPYEVIKIDKYTQKIQTPTLLLMTRSFDIIGKIPHFTDWNISLVGNGIDEISFTVPKCVNGNKCPVWDDLIDLKIIDVRGFGRFEISVDYTDNTETVKSVHGQSLEVELSQIPLYEFHVNDDDAIKYMAEKDTDKNGEFIPTVFYDPNNKSHSLLHRVLADEAPHWSIGYVTPYIALSEDTQRESSAEFKRTYTVDGTTIYDFLTGDVAEESNVIFIFDTNNRTINCYNLCDCVDLETGDIHRGIGEDTNILVSKRKLANEIVISSNKDNVKNCFRVEGGDDVITDMVRVVNMNGSNYIYQFADFQLNDMSENLRNKLLEYQKMISSKELQDEYYGENGIYTKLCNAYDDLSHYESSMMPEVVISETTAEEQYHNMVSELINMSVGVSSVNNYNNDLFVGVTNNIEAIAQILVDARYKVEVIDGTASYDSYSYIWTGNIKVTRVTDENEYYPKTTEQVNTYFKVNVNDDELLFIKQKIEKALAKGSMLDIDFDVAEMNDDEIREYFSLYSLNRLKSFYEGYNSCISILSTMGQTTTPDVQNELYNKYYNRLTIVEEIYKNRQIQVNSINSNIESLQQEQSDFQKKYKLNLQEYLGDKLFLEFCSYRREDTYKNDNYISDSLSTSKCIKKAKELVEVAAKEARKACVLQRTVSTSLNNLFALPEFESFYDKFALFNYIRIRTEDEIVKLRLIGIEFNGESVSDINVTFSEQIESVDGTMSDLQSIIQQANSIATSYSSTILQAQKGAEAKNTFIDIYNNGLNAAKAMLTNNDNNEITVTSSGIICKRMDDEGFYGEKQLRITGNMMAFTKNNWQTVESAFGETTFDNPFTGRKEKKYGLIADAIVGKIIAGENMYIGNKNGSVQITGDGIVLDGGKITWINPIKQENVEGLDTTLSEYVEKVVYNKDIAELQKQIDGNITTWFYDYTPTNSNKPAVDWETDDEKIAHEGDLFYCTDSNNAHAYRYVYDNTIKQHKWILIEDTDVTKALADAAHAQDTADCKRRVFVTTPATPTPTPPYDIGDLWSQGENGDLLKCIVTKLKEQTYEPSDWDNASKYTDDTAWQTWTSDTGEFGQYKKDIQTQIDGKSNCTYGGSTPPNNPETGDLWFCTDGSKGYGKDKAYMYDGSTWKESNGVPDSVWDIADGKSSIFVVKPNKALSSVDSHFYYANDIWILESNMTLNGKTYKKGSIMTSTSDSTSFVESHWIEKVRYTDDTNLNSYKEEVSQFQNKVNMALTGGTNEMGTDYVISPKIGGGYLYIKDGRATNNTGISVEINPNGTSFTGHNNDYVFNIQKDSNIIMGVTNDGSGYFSGTIYADKGYIGGNSGFKIETGKIYSNNHNVFDSDVNGVYIGNDGISLGKNGAAWIKNNGSFSFGNGKLTYSGNELKFEGAITTNNAIINGGRIQIKNEKGDDKNSVMIDNHTAQLPKYTLIGGEPLILDLAGFNDSSGLYIKILRNAGSEDIMLPPATKNSYGSMSPVDKITIADNSDNILKLFDVANTLTDTTNTLTTKINSINNKLATATYPNITTSVKDYLRYNGSYIGKNNTGRFLVFLWHNMNNGMNIYTVYATSDTVNTHILIPANTNAPTLKVSDNGFVHVFGCDATERYAFSFVVKV